VRHTLLVVESESTLRFAIRRYFEAQGVAVDVFESNQDASTIAAVRRYDALLVDYRPAQADDAQAVIIACREKNPDIVVIALTSSRLDRVEIDATHVRLKPIRLPELAELLGVGGMA